MLRHYVVVALRILRRSPFTAAANILTLSVGLVCFLTAYAYSTFWMLAERGFHGADRIYVLSMSTRFRGADVDRSGQLVPVALVELLKTDFPEIETLARAMVINRQRTSVSTGERATRLDAVAVDPQFLEIFDLPFISGDPKLALSRPRSVVITKASAIALFGGEDPVGRSLFLENSVDTTVTGVIDVIPEPSHLGRSVRAIMHVDLLASMDVQEAISGNGFSRAQAMTYLLLPNDTRAVAASIRAKLPDFVAARIPPESLATLGYAAISLDVRPVRDLLQPGGREGIFLHVSPEAELWLFGAVILVIACVNYANLAVARMGRRIREVGIRRSVGAGRWHVMAQFLLDTSLTTVGALVVALAIFWQTMPSLESLAGAPFGEALFADNTVWLFLLAVVIFATVVAGGIPAFSVAYVKPISAIRASGSSIALKRVSALLVAVQFAVASLLIVAVVVTSLQNAEVERNGFGVTDDPIVVIQNPSFATKVDSSTLREELARLAHVTGTTEMRSLPWQTRLTPQVSASPDPASPAQTVVARDVGFDFFAVFDIPILAGRVFHRDTDAGPSSVRGASEIASQTRSIIIDRAFSEEFGFRAPAGAVGEVVYMANPRAPGGVAVQREPLLIVGVVDTVPFAFEDYGRTPHATLYRLATGSEFQVVRLEKGDVAGTLEDLDSVWKRLSPNVAINRQFLDDVLKEYYETYLRASRLFGALALMALFIAALGAAGMATLITERRTKEIALRKALGGKKRQVIAMLLGHFMWPVLIANLAAWPVAYMFAHAYLQRFIHPVSLTAWPFGAALAISVVIAVLASIAQTARAARTHPAKVLGYE